MKNIFHRALFVSLLLHLLFTLIFKMDWSAQKTSKKSPTTTIDFISVEELQKQLQSKGQIVDQSKKALNDEVPEKAKFLSRHNQTVLKETRAANTGEFNNQAGARGQSQDRVAPEKKLAPKRKKIVTLKDLKPQFAFDSGHKAQPTEQDQEQERQSRKAARAGSPSQTDDFLKDVPTGLQTVLNTREFIYFSYYNRIKTKLRQYWEPMIKKKIVKILRSGRRIAAVDRITNLVITLDQNGQLVKVQVVGESGVTDLDDAAVQAFRAAAPFPNPPKGIVESDGTIKIRWDFILEA